MSDDAAAPAEQAANPPPLPPGVRLPLRRPMGLQVFEVIAADPPPAGATPSFFAVIDFKSQL